MEVCPEAELIAIEDPATVCDGAFQIGEGLEVLVSERLIQNRPEVLGGLELGGVWGQVDEPEALRHDQVRCGVPAGVSSPRAMMRSRPAPASRATKARSAAKNGFEMPFDMCRKVSPEIGWVKAVTDNHL